MFNPVSTYRIQFHKGFTFKNFEQIIPYLYELGVNTIYASPIFEATPGSNHGYDIVNPHRINPEIGTLNELKRISKKLRGLGMGWLQDIVPNHMAFHSNNNWLMDVMERGRDSRYANYFDIIWEAPPFNGRLMAPFLGDSLQDLIQNKQLKLAYLNDGFKFTYGDQAYPVNLPSLINLFERVNVEQPDVIREIISKTNGNNYSIDDFKENFAEAYHQTVIKSYVKSILITAGEQPELIHSIADAQYYKLSYWKDSDTQINYRRFFTVNGLICLNIQDQAVFDHYHRFVKTLLDDGIFQGIRVDHIDGLYDPAIYLQRLRQLCGDDTYIVVEKILEEGEKFPTDWPVQGNTGYDFLALVNNLFTTIENKHAFTGFYKELVNDKRPVAQAILEKKANILYQHMAGELENLYRLSVMLKLVDEVQQINADDIKAAIAEFLICCPVYRYYGNSLPLDIKEGKAIESIFNVVEKHKPQLRPAVGLLRDAWLKPIKQDSRKAAALRFYQRCMQFTGPLMAKGVEDTLMYTYSRFIGHNEVGDSPAAFGLELTKFHELMIDRQQHLPQSLNTTSTHDTKRGEDVRARLNSVTAIAGEWIGIINKWCKLNQPLKTNNAPDINDEYLIYQTLIGFYPMAGEDDSDIIERLQAYLTKALREAKIHTQWAEPDVTYEKATLNFAVKLLDKKSKFWKSFLSFRNKVADAALVNSLTQLVLKFTCPGIPDIYQGTELWDLSLVDPDNRRHVDYDVRNTYLNNKADINTLWENRYNGNVKLYLTRLLLQLRKENPALLTGNYVPLKVRGKLSDCFIAYARQYLREWLIVIAPIRPLNKKEWTNISILLPEDAPIQWEDLINERALIINGTMPLQQLFGALPAAVLKSAKHVEKRSAGVIMHITSLPSNFAIGDMGPQARAFADFLAGSNQKYWQLLPINPTGPAAGNSPYSVFSSMAGNTALISPEELCRQGLLTSDELKRYEIQSAKTVDYELAYTLKRDLLHIAFDRFTEFEEGLMNAKFSTFCDEEAYWLDDFAMYEVLKSVHDFKPWYEWPDAHKCRQDKALQLVKKRQAVEIVRSKWFQFVFFEQWLALKSYGNECGIQFFGDLPFYVSYDSADVWTHPELFKLDKNKQMAGIAGVPPDYFNASGQLWGMPVYDWNLLAASDYKWWVDRIRKNIEFFDVLRLDHFRAFYDYWEVPAGETTAVNGKWQPGPGAALFKILKEELGDLPFIAEDLGDVSPGVYALRDELGLPGMNLLQYAFGLDMPVSVHIPHNHINHSVTYTGTHDNNTTIGWYKQNTSKTERLNMSNYVHSKVTRENVHDIMIALCYASTSEIAIVPLQDILGLDETCRMNMPSSKQGNWAWRLQHGQITKETEIKLRNLVKRYNR